MSLTLVLGGTRSGKSRHAERLAAASGRPVRYVATADGADPAMAERVREHAARRPPEWTTVEAGEALAAAVREAGPGRCVLLDGLGGWIAGVLHEAGAFDGGLEDSALGRLREKVRAQVAAVAEASAEGAAVIVVAEEAGQGVLPPDRASRAWLDLLGESVQLLGARADRVELVVAGRALSLHGNSAGPAGARGAAAAKPPARVGGAESAEDLRHHGDRVLRPGDADHAVNVLAGGPPQWLRDALREALDGDAERYPSEGEAIAALSALHGREPAEVVPTNGAAEALWLLPAALRPSRSVCVHPAFTEAEAALRAHGATVTRVLRDPERDFALEPDAVPAEADLVVLGNPASPSGTLDPAAALLALRRPGRVVVVDEAFMDLVPGEPGSLARERAEDVVVVRSFTKSLSIPGLRAGYALAPPALAERLRAVRPPWSANALALAALAAAASHPDVLAALAERAQAERQDLVARLTRLDGVRTWPAAANFCLVEVPDGPAAVRALRDRGIAVRCAASFPGLGPGHLRITARSPEQNERLARGLEEALA
jgi:histidinol-phosphate/aromatic aminotransferase/cobyric acid decarboxylase-like protein/adenosyl cobinamide kinase/adenosyl cobinamide phosphate guanylyltransferase